MKEVWKLVCGYEKKYEISNTGRCRNIITGKLLKQNMSFKYSRYSLCQGGLKVNKLIHRMVAEAFIDNPFSFETVNHKDENRRNNHANNLEWCTQIENSRKYYYGAGNQKIGKYDMAGNLISTHETSSEAGRSIGKKHNAISMCLNKIRNTAYGFTWKYI